MFGMVQDLLHTEKDDDFNKVFSRVEKVIMRISVTA